MKSIFKNPFIFWTICLDEFRSTLWRMVKSALTHEDTWLGVCRGSPRRVYVPLHFLYVTSRHMVPLMTQSSFNYFQFTIVIKIHKKIVSAYTQSIKHIYHSSKVGKREIANKGKFITFSPLE